MSDLTPQDYQNAYFFGQVWGPIIGIGLILFIVVFIALGKYLYEKEHPESREPSYWKKTKTCAFCKSEIPKDATKCRACGEWVDSAKPVDKKPETASTLQDVLEQCRREDRRK
jgi:hypothetical protein